MSRLVADFNHPEWGRLTLPIRELDDGHPVVYDPMTETVRRVGIYAQREKLELLDLRLPRTLVPCTRPAIAVFTNREGAERTYPVHYWEHAPDASDVLAHPVVLTDYGLVQARHLPEDREELDGYRFRRVVEVPA
jgi:hypothetical protein